MNSLHVVLSASGNGYGSHYLELPSTTKKQQSCILTGVDKVDELRNAFGDMLQVKDDKVGTRANLSSDDDGSSGLEDDIIAGACDIILDGAKATPSKYLQKCVTFPVTVGAEENTTDSQLKNNSVTCLLSLPNAPKLISAMKGGREKAGVPSKKLTVTWAPDVYDPPPTSVSHYTKKKAQQHFKSNKKHGKGKQKGKNMRGGGNGPKDKKHHRKTGGRSDRCVDSYVDADRIISSNSYISSVEMLDFDAIGDIGSPDSNCGSSYLGKAGGAVHFAYAEAT